MIIIVLLAIALISCAHAACPPSLSAYSVQNAVVPSTYCASVFATNLLTPRGLYITEYNDLVIVETGGGSRISVLRDTNSSGIAQSHTVIATVNGDTLTGELTIDGGFLYASSALSVYRFTFDAANPTAVLTNATIVVTNLSTGLYTTRALIVDNNNRLYIAVGAAANVDYSTNHALIYRCNLNAVPAGGYTPANMETFVSGVRNVVGMTVYNNVIYGVENSIQSLNRSDLPANIATFNPAEKLNKFIDNSAQSFYGLMHTPTCAQRVCDGETF